MTKRECKNLLQELLEKHVQENSRTDIQVTNISHLQFMVTFKANPGTPKQYYIVGVKEQL